MTEFLDNLFELYPNSWNLSNKNLKLAQYYKVIDKPHIDYRKLSRIMAEEYQGDFMPPPAWLGERLCRCYKSESRQQYCHVKVFDPRFGGKIDICFEGNPTDEQILKTLDKRYPGHEGWRIL